MKNTKGKKSLHSWEYTTYASSNLIPKRISPQLHPPINNAKALNLLQMGMVHKLTK